MLIFVLQIKFGLEYEMIRKCMDSENNSSFKLNEFHMRIVDTGQWSLFEMFWPKDICESNEIEMEMPKFIQISHIFWVDESPFFFV